MNTAALAATHKQAKMTRKEFVALDEGVKPKLVYWAEGFNRKVEPEEAIVDIETTDKLVPVLDEECQAAPKKTFWEEVKKHL